MLLGRTFPDQLQDLADEVNEWVDELMCDYAPVRYSQGKIFRDAVHNHLWFHPHECSVIDSPFLQRLKYIHQTAFAFQAYHSANHTRFEHSLGVSALAGRMISALHERQSFQSSSGGDVLEVRLAGLLHDTGHGLFSHLSEGVMGQRFRSSLNSIRRSRYFEKGNVKYGELLSFLIVRSPGFRRFWNELQEMYPNLQIDLDKISGFIVGQASEVEQYKADIISGPFDADKLDYFARDAFFTGIKVEVDTERVVHTAKILSRSGKPRALVMARSGVPHLEQILFGKMML